MSYYIDPPSGWKYGFPKIAPSGLTNEELDKWIVENGYPKEEMNKYSVRPFCEYYCRFWEADMKNNKQDHINFYLSSKGFKFTFDNGYTVSVVWGEGCYSDRVDNNSALTAEVAVFSHNKDWVHVDGYEYHGDNVLPRLTVYQVLDIMNKVSQLPNEE